MFNKLSLLTGFNENCAHSPLSFYGWEFKKKRYWEVEFFTKSQEEKQHAYSMSDVGLEVLNSL